MNDDLDMPQKFAQAMHLVEKSQEGYDRVKKLDLFSVQADLLCQSLLSISHALIGMIRLNNLFRGEEMMELDKRDLTNQIKMIKLTGIVNEMANSLTRSTTSGLVKELLAVLQSSKLEELVEMSQTDLMKLLGVSWEEVVTKSDGVLTDHEGHQKPIGTRSGTRRMVGPYVDFKTSEGT